MFIVKYSKKYINKNNLGQPIYIQLCISI